MRTLRVRDLLPFSHTRPTVTSAEASLRQVAEKMVEDPKTREVYVLDREQRLVGIITLRRLARCVFASEVSSDTSPTALLELVGSKTAGDLAQRKPVYVHEDDSLEKLLRVMFRYDLNEIPVVSRQGHITGNLNMLEVLSAWLKGELDEIRR